MKYKTGLEVRDFNLFQISMLILIVKEKRYV